MTRPGAPSAIEEIEDDLDVAIIGMAGRFPGAPDLDRFWSNLTSGTESITFLSDHELADAGVPASISQAQGYVRATSRLDDIAMFDAAFFGYSPKEAALMDPQSRVALELAWHALEDAACSPFDYAGAIGVFASASLSTYLLNHLADRLDPQDFILGLGNIPIVLGNGPDFVATRISYKLNLRGPSLVVQTACSSSLTAIHQARQSLLNRECDVALAGGVSIYLPQDRGYLYQDGMILSPDGHARAFDAQADGIRFGRGGGMVVLKPLANALADGDRIRAIIKGSAINNDGSRKVGFTAPSQAGQSRVIAEALADAGVRADSISYVEAHGTGTRVGDPIEIAALSEAFRKHTNRVGYCAIGTVKTNIGHLDVAAGVTGVIKTVLMLEQRQIPASLHFTRPNPAIDFPASPFYVNTALKPWQVPSGPLRAGVSSFGIGGTNAHVILQEAPAAVPSHAPARPVQIMRVTGRSEGAVTALAAKLVDRLADSDLPGVADICSTANTGRPHLPYRLVVRAASSPAMREALSSVAAGHADPRIVRNVQAVADAPPLAFLFTGLGAQMAGMGKELFETEPVFRDALERCDALLRAHMPMPLLRVLYPGPGESTPIDQTVYGQPVMFAFEYALATLWQSWGVRPAVLLGHSLGEYCAACVSGLLTLEDALRLVALRARLMGALSAGGGMAAVFASEQAVLDALAPEGSAVAIASINSPESVVISGDVDALSRVLAGLAPRGIEARMLNVTHAFHSARLEPMLDEFETAVAQSRFGHPRIPIVSNLTGLVLGENEGRDPRYWRRHAREVVRFADGVQTLLAQGLRHFLEIGPHTTATGMAAGCDSGDSAVFLPSLRRGRDDWDQILETLSELYVRGVEVDWSGLDREPRRRVALPLYPFARTRHWIDGRTPTPLRGAEALSQPMLRRAIRSPLFTESAFEVAVDPAVHPFLEDHCIFGVPVFPATGYIETAFEALQHATGQSGTLLEDLEIAEALTTARSTSREAQVIVKPDQGGFHFEFFAASERATGWTRCAAGRVSQPAAATPSGGRIDVTAIRARADRVESGSDFYAALARRGFVYGPSFQGVQSISVGQDEVLGDVHLTSAIVDATSGFRFHPALLDACLQIVLAAVPAGRTFLPTRIGRLLLGEWAPRLIAHAQLRPSANGARTIACDVRIVDEHGRFVAEFSDILLQQTDARQWTASRPHAWEQWLYRAAWRPAPLPAQEGIAALPSPAHVGEAMLDRLEEARAQHGLAEYESVQEALDTACADYAAEAFRQLGWHPDADDSMTTADICRTLSIPPAHRRMAHRLLEMLAEDGRIARSGPGWRAASTRSRPLTVAIEELPVRYPRFSKMFEIVDRCGRSLARGLRGEVEAVDLLFPGGSLGDLEALYHSSPFARAYNELVAHAVADIVRSLPERSVLRVLEVGAGTGGTTASVLPQLAADRTRYVYTDMSRLFLARAEERFAAFPFVTYRIFDAELDPLEQGFAPESFDLIVASNVLHATRSLHQTMTHMQQLLAPGGLVVMVEGVTRQRWVDLVFGLTDGWWKYADAELRGDYPLVSTSQWQAVLSQTGFGEFSTVPDQARPAALFHQAVMVARRIAEAPASSQVRRRWLIIRDEAGLGAELAQRVQATGTDEAVLITAAADPTSWREVIRTAADARTVDAVVLFGPAGATPADADTGTKAMLELVQVLTSHPSTSSSRVWIVTRGAQAVDSNDAMAGAFAASMWGLAQVVQLEHPELRCTCIDLDPADGACGQTLWDELSAETPETRVGYRHGRRHVSRLERAVRNEVDTPLLTNSLRRLESSTPGEIEGLHYVDHVRRAPGQGEVEIRVCATGLNFKDVLTVLGRFPVPAAGLGFECSGEISAVGPGVTTFAVGDPVVAMAPGSLATHLIADAHLVAPMPASLTFEEAATVAGGFLTAHYALHTLARIGPGDRVLIHAATGGVGLAVVQLARLAGAEIFATAGSEAKRALLASLGVVHVFSSRDTEFAPAIERLTGGVGVTIVVNSLTGSVREKSFEVLADGGRFIELGAGGEGTSTVETGRNVEYHQPNVAEEGLRSPAAFGAVLRDVLASVDQRELTALPHRTFDASDTIGAFRLMARAGHVGKVVIRQAGGAHGGGAAAGITGDATYLIAGGLGGLGILVAGHLVDRGARHIALMARRRASAPEQAALDRLTARGADVFVVQGDVSRRDDVDAVVSGIEREHPPLRGVIQAAGLLDDGVLAQQTWSRFTGVMAPKVAGSWHLHEATSDLPLDFFVMFSSVASLLGSPGQGNHAAANAVLDALATYRRSRGLPGLSISWGAWSGVGAAARREISDRIAARGMGEIAPDEGLAALDHLLTWPHAHVGVVPMDWAVFGRGFAKGQEPLFVSELLARTAPSDVPVRPSEPTAGLIERLRQATPGERRGIVAQFIREQVIKGLGLPSDQPIDGALPLAALGLDSLLAVELRNTLSRGLRVTRRLSATLLFDYPSIDALTDHLLLSVEQPEAAPAPPMAVRARQPERERATTLDDDAIASLSDEEAEALLLEELE